MVGEELVFNRSGTPDPLVRYLPKATMHYQTCYSTKYERHLMQKSPVFRRGFLISGR